MKALVDVFVIVPLCFPYDIRLQWVPFQRQWLSIGFLRIITALDAFRRVLIPSWRHAACEMLI